MVSDQFTLKSRVCMCVFYHHLSCGICYADSFGPRSEEVNLWLSSRFQPPLPCTIVGSRAALFLFSFSHTNCPQAGIPSGLYMLLALARIGLIWVIAIAMSSCFFQLVLFVAEWTSAAKNNHGSPPLLAGMRFCPDRCSSWLKEELT